jgi:hypothetical protein
VGNVFDFPGTKAKVSDEEITKELLTVLDEMRKIVEDDAESILVVGFTRNDTVYGAFGGLMNPIAMAGLLERVKLQLLTS